MVDIWFPPSLCSKTFNPLITFVRKCIMCQYNNTDSSLKMYPGNILTSFYCLTLSFRTHEHFFQFFRFVIIILHVNLLRQNPKHVIGNWKKEQLGNAKCTLSQVFFVQKANRRLHRHIVKKNYIIINIRQTCFRVVRL